LHNECKRGEKKEKSKVKTPKTKLKNVKITSIEDD